MRNYTLYIEDDRYSVPTLEFVTAANDVAARRVAREKLSDRHHLSVEIREDERVIGRLVHQAYGPDDMSAEG